MPDDLTPDAKALAATVLARRGIDPNAVLAERLPLQGQALHLRTFVQPVRVDPRNPDEALTTDRVVILRGRDVAALRAAGATTTEEG